MITQDQRSSHRKKVLSSIILILLLFLIEFTISLMNGFIVGFYDLSGSEYIELLADFIIVCTSLYIIYLFSKRLDVVILLNKVSNYKPLLYASVLFFLIILLNDFLEEVILNLLPSLSSLEDLSYSKENFDFHSIIFLGLLYPLIEELSFRGILYKVIREENSFIFSASVVSLLFFIVHPIPQAFILFYGMSFLLCYLYENYNSIVPPLILHCLYNILVFIFAMYVI